MSAQVIPFVYNDKPVRSVEKGGDPWFVGKDVCCVLDIRDHHQALDRLDNDERGRCNVPTPQGPQEVIIISEAGVYRLVFSSRKAEAEAFKRWLAHEVLPQLRRTGKFAVKGEEADPLGGMSTELINAKANLVRLSRTLHGPARAARLWADLGLPSVAPLPKPDGRESERCLAMLLDAETPDEFTVREAIGIAWSSRLQREALGKLGIRIMDDPDGVAISNTVAFPQSVFDGTEFGQRRWIRLLRSLPGVVPVNTRYGEEQTRGTFIPADLIAP